MSVALCGRCHAQYDVSARKPGGSFRCHCGAMVAVPAPVTRDARIVRCASCGAVRGANTDHCEYCGARFSAADKGWGAMCPLCFCRLPNDAQYCVECGLKISPQTITGECSELPCPRCKCLLHTRKLENIELHECPDCAGLWLSVQTFEHICKDKEVLAEATRGLAAHPEPPKYEPNAEEAVHYLPCPQCKNLMNRHNFADISGVIINTCRTCGIWLDNQALDHIVHFIEAGGLEKAHEHELQEEEHRKHMAMMGKHTWQDYQETSNVVHIIEGGSQEKGSDMLNFFERPTAPSWQWKIGVGLATAPVLVRVLGMVIKAFLK